MRLKTCRFKYNREGSGFFIFEANFLTSKICNCLHENSSIFNKFSALPALDKNNQVLSFLRLPIELPQTA